MLTVFTAAAWDNNPDVHRASDGARDAILAAFPSLKESRDSRESGMGSVEGMLFIPFH